MSKPYEKLIDFCKAEVVSPTSKVATVEDFGVGYTIRFPILHTSIDIYKPAEADRIDSADAILGGFRGQYRLDKRFEPLCEMLGLNSPWIPCPEGLPEEGVDVLVFTDGGHQDVALIQFFDESGNPWWFNGDRNLTVTHYQPLPPGPLERG